MGIAATWSLGMSAPRVISGEHKPGVAQRWTIQIVAEAGRVRQRWTMRPRSKVTLHDVEGLVQEEIAQFSKENGELEYLQWTAISR